MSKLKMELLDRDAALLMFNERVLSQVENPQVPLLERLRYLCIVSSNLDEFFEVRMAQHMAKYKEDPSPQHAGLLNQIHDQAKHLVARQYALYHQALMPALQKEGIAILSHKDRNAAQRRWVSAFFNAEVLPLLTPISLDPSHPFPQTANKALHFIARLSGKDAFGRDNPISIVRVPRALPRVIALPKSVAGKGQAFVLLSSVIRAQLHTLYHGRAVVDFSQFRVTRDSDLWVDETDVSDLREALRTELSTRQFSLAMRLEVSESCPHDLIDFLRQQFALPTMAVYSIEGPLNLVRLISLPDMVRASTTLRFPAWTPKWPSNVDAEHSLFNQIATQDILLHHPYQSFEVVLQFLREAVRDPDVVAIRQTIYRTGNQSALIPLLLEAIKRGKEVMVVVELKARFDEKTNIDWAEQLERIGAQVVYGVVGLKTHAKMLLVLRREGKKLKRYVHLSTGSYNANTARLYTDWGFLTADPDYTQDVEVLFSHLGAQLPLPPLKKLTSAPFTLHHTLSHWVEAVRVAATKGQIARIRLKMNSLTEEKLITDLLACAQAGGKIELWVRGASQLPLALAHDNIRLYSVIGRFLEHARVFHFQAHDQEALYLSSADWMSRNLFRRFEVAWPIESPTLRARVLHESFEVYADSVLWQQTPTGRYERINPEGRHGQVRLQEMYEGLPLMSRLSTKAKARKESGGKAAKKAE